MKKKYIAANITVLLGCHCLMIRADAYSDHGKPADVLSGRAFDFSHMGTVGQVQEVISDLGKYGLDVDAVEQQLMHLHEIGKLNFDEMVNLLMEIDEKEKREPSQTAMPRFSSLIEKGTFKDDSEGGRRHTIVVEAATLPSVADNSILPSLADKKDRKLPKKKSQKSTIDSMADDKGGDGQIELGKPLFDNNEDHYDDPSSEPTYPEIEEINEGMENPVPRGRNRQRAREEQDNLKPGFNVSEGERVPSKTLYTSTKHDSSNRVFDTHPDKNHTLPVKVLFGFGGFIRGLLGF